MVLRTYKIPPQPHMPFKLNPLFPDLESHNVYIASKGMMLRPQKKDTPIKVFVNSFDASVSAHSSLPARKRNLAISDLLQGGNTCLALEEAPVQVATSDDVRPAHVIVVSGKTKNAFLNNRKRIRAYIKAHPKAKIADLAYTTTARRMHEMMRTCYTGATTDELLRKLDADIDQAIVPANETAPKVTFVFTGQGSQYAGMSRDLYHTQNDFRDMIKSYDGIAIAQGLPSFIHLISEDGLDIATESPATVQMALVSLEIAMANLWLSWGMKPDLVIGHSLGEYAALCLAGVLSVSDTLYLVGRRAMLLEEKLSPGTYTMLVIRAAALVIQSHLDTINLTSCQISLKNSPTMTVVSGLKDEIEKLSAHLKSHSLTTTLLTLPYGFHSEQLNPILDDFESLACGAVFSKPKIPVASTLLAKVIEDEGTFSATYLRNQMRQAVDYVGTLEAAHTSGHMSKNMLFVEVGPQPICSSLIAATLGPSSRRLVSLKPGENAWATISEAIATAYSAGSPVDWAEYHRLFSENVSLLDLPTYAFDETDFWTPFIAPANALPTTQVQEKNESKIFEPNVPGFPSSSLQRLEDWRIDETVVSSKFTSNMSDPELSETVFGHIVNGFAILPAGIFAEMAMSAAQYIQRRLQPPKKIPVSQFAIHNLDITKPIVLTEEDNSKDISILASHAQGSSTTTVQFEILSTTGSTACGRCDVTIGDNSAERDALSRSKFLLQSRIETLAHQGQIGSAHSLSKLVIYRLFENLVKVGPKSRAIQSAVLGSSFRDASAEVVLASASSTTSFRFQPYWIDALVQISGVLLNCGLNYPEETVFISQGLQSWCFFEELKSDRAYTSYVQYQDMKPDSSIEGDVTVFCEGRLVSHLRGVRFHMLKRATLSAMLSVGSRSAASKTQNVPISRSEVPRLEKLPPQSAPALVPSVEPVAHPTPSLEKPKLQEARQLMEIIASETGYPVEEINAKSAFSDIGVDSLMAITIGAVVKDQMKLDLAATFFLDHFTVGNALDTLGFNRDFENVSEAAVAQAISVAPVAPLASAYSLPTLSLPLIIAPRSDAGADTSSSSSPTSSDTDYFGKSSAVFDNDPPFSTLWTVVATPSSSVCPTPPLSHDEQKPATPSCKIVHLQGPTLAEANIPALFLIADETGTVGRYIDIPDVDADDLPVYGVLSPFLGGSIDAEIDIHDLAARMATTISEKASRGLYRLGGYSVGGLVAYMVAMQLLDAGHDVETLILLDSPLPFPGISLSSLTLEDVRGAGVVRGNHVSGQFVSNVPVTQQEHVCRIMRSLPSFAQSLPAMPKQPVKSLYVYAKDGFRKTGDTGSPLVKSWMESSWGSVGRDTWKELIPGLEAVEMEGDHFNVMEYPRVNHLQYHLERRWKSC